MSGVLPFTTQGCITSPAKFSRPAVAGKCESCHDRYMAAITSIEVGQRISSRPIRGYRFDAQAAASLEDDTSEEPIVARRSFRISPSAVLSVSLAFIIAGAFTVGAGFVVAKVLAFGASVLGGL